MSDNEEYCKTMEEVRQQFESGHMREAMLFDQVEKISEINKNMKILQATFEAQTSMSRIHEMESDCLAEHEDRLIELEVHLQHKRDHSAQISGLQLMLEELNKKIDNFKVPPPVQIPDPVDIDELKDKLKSWLSEKLESQQPGDTTDLSSLDQTITNLWNTQEQQQTKLEKLEQFETRLKKLEEDRKQTQLETRLKKLEEDNQQQHQIILEQNQTIQQLQNMVVESAGFCQYIAGTFAQEEHARLARSHAAMHFIGRIGQC